MKNRAGFTSEQKKRMTLNNETLLAIRRTGRVHQSIILSFISCIIVKSFIELVQYLFTLPEVKDNQLAFLSNKLCQDPLENFFRCQRQRGGTHDNPKAHDFYHNTQALRVIDTFCRGPIRGNYRENQTKRALDKPITESDLAPLPKRVCRKKL